jgi:hypothetical protein
MNLSILGPTFAARLSLITLAFGVIGVSFLAGTWVA